MPHLQVMVGPDRHHMEPCRVNDTHRPHEIDTEHFVGRVLVRILDAPGAREGEEGREYFTDRSRKFCIQIEGRFKKEWTGDQVHFGTDFDKFIDFPRAPFNAGMRVAKYIDPCTFYEEQPPSKRPYIMSPYCACMNVLCAWPAPSRAHDAVVVLRHTNKSTDHSPERPATPLIDPEKKGNAHDSLVVPSSGNGAHRGDSEDEDDDVVPREGLSRSGSRRNAESTAAGKPQKKKGSWFSFGGSQKEERVLKKYWRFVGFKDEPRVRAMLEAHHAKLESKRGRVLDGHVPQRSTSVQSSESSATSNNADVQHGIAANHPTLRKLGTSVRGKLPRFSSDDPGTPSLSGNPMSGDVSPMDSPVISGQDEFFTAPEPNQASPGAGAPSSASLPPSGAQEGESMPEMPPLERITTDVRNEAEKSAKRDGLREEDFKLAGELHHHKAKKGAWQSKLDDQLGPWRFDDPGTDMVEDNAFIFTNDSLSVPKRRKYFASQANREKFVYNPHVVYAASFFTDAFDFNTFGLGLGPVSLNLARFFKEMPIRYTLRAADEEPSFCTISFQLVD